MYVTDIWTAWAQVIFRVKQVTTTQVVQPSVQGIQSFLEVHLHDIVTTLPGVIQFHQSISLLGSNNFQSFSAFICYPIHPWSGPTDE